MEKTYYKVLVKRYFLYTAAACSFLICFFILLFYIIDPLQLFHRSWFWPKDILSWNMREQAAGIINQYTFDSIILGTSMLENTSAAEAGEKLGGTFFNISMAGSSYYERSFPLKKALRKNISKVLYSLDENYLFCNKENSRSPADQWTVLYDENWLNDFIYYATIKNISYFFSKKKFFGLRKTDLDRPNAWFATDIHSRRFGGLKNWVDNMDVPGVKDFLLGALPDAAAKSKKCGLTVVHNPEQEQKAKEYIYEYLLQYVEQYPKTDFYCIFPPYFRYRYAKLLQLNPEIFFLHQEVIRYMVEKSAYFPNLHVYGFEDQDFLDDITNYRDRVHHHYQYNSVMLDAIRAGNELTPENVEQYLWDCQEKAWNFDIGALNAEAQRLLRERKAARGED